MPHKKIIQKHIGGDAVYIENAFIQPIKDDQIASISSEINKRNKKVSAIPHNSEKTKKEIKAWADSDGFFTLVENSTIKENISTLTFNQKQKRMLDNLTYLMVVLDETHQGALMNAVKIYCREDEVDKLKDFSNESYERIEKLTSERQRYESSKNGDTFKKIYNLLRSYDIKEEVLPILRELYEKYNGNIDKIKPDFQKYWLARLSRHPNKVWISSHLEFEHQNIEQEIVDRLILKKCPAVLLYSRGGHANAFAKEITSKLKEDFSKEYKVTFQDRKIAKIPCLCHVFTLLK